MRKTIKYLEKYEYIFAIMFILLFLVFLFITALISEDYEYAILFLFMIIGVLFLTCTICKYNIVLIMKNKL
jgi:hypothetical protein